MSRFSPMAAAVVLLMALPAHGRKLPAGHASTVSKAVSKAMIDGLAAELERSMSMRVPGSPSPYFVSYKLTEVEVNDATATLGSITSKNSRHFVTLEAHVHVGTYKRDNTNFVVSQADHLDGIATAQLPLEATPAIARKLAWLVTDQAYKEALEQYRAKLDALSSGTNGSENSSYSKTNPLVMEKPVLVAQLESEKKLIARTKRLSRVFRATPNVRDSRVSITSFLERRWYLNSEGTSSHDTRRVSGVVVAASGQADDGQELNLFFRRYGHTGDQLPSDAEIESEAKKLAATLDKLAKAPIVDAYAGPVLFEGDGATGMVRHTLAPHLTGTPPPVGVSAQDVNQAFGGSLHDRLGRRVLPSFLSVHDDPSIHFTAARIPLIGGYRFDDEGVRAQRIEIAKDGILKTLPMGRTPSASIPKSNGHARRSVAGGLFRGAPTNLSISTKKATSRKKLIKELVRLVKQEGLPYGLVIKQFNDVAITASPELSRAETVTILRDAEQGAPPLATLAYRVYANGREELVRGVQLKKVNVKEWRRVVAVGKRRVVRNFLEPSDALTMLQVAGGDDGYVPSAGVESSVHTPSLLFPELDVARSTLRRRPKPPLPRP